MFKPIVILFLLLVAESSIGQTVDDFNFQLVLQNKLKHLVKEIDVKDAAKDTSVLFLDAREYKEYEISHIKNARHVGYKKFSLDKLSDIPKNKKLIVYCSIGYRSEKIAGILKKKGYTNCYNLYGGIFEWVNQQHPVYDSKNDLTKQVHVYNYKWSVWLNGGEKVFK